MPQPYTSSTWRATGLSPGEIQLQAAQSQLKLRDKVDPYCPQGHNGDTLSAEMRDRLGGLVQRFIEARKRVLSQAMIAGDSDSHPWAGITKSDINPAELTQIIERLTAWQAALVAVSGLLTDLRHFLPAGADASMPIAELGPLIEALELLPEPDDDVIWEYLPSLSGARLQQSRGGLDMFLNLGALSIRLANRLSPWDMFDQDCLSRHQKGVRTLQTHLAAEATLGQLRDVLLSADMFSNDLRKLQPELASLNHIFRMAGTDVFATSCRGLYELDTLLETIAALPHAYLQWRDPAIADANFDTALSHLRRDIEDLNRRADALQETFDLSALPSVNQLERIRTALDGGKSSLWLNTRGRAIRQELARFCLDSELPLQQISPRMTELVEYAIAHKALCDHPIYAKHLGKLFQGPQTDLRMAEALGKWYRAIQEEYSGQRAPLGKCILTLPDTATLSIRKLRQRHQQLIEQALDTYRKWQAVLADDAPMHDPQCDLLTPDHGVASVARDLREALDRLRDLATDDKLTVGHLCTDVQAQAELINGQAKWERFRNEHALFKGMEMEIHGSVTSEAMLRKAISTLTLADCIDSIPLPSLRKVLQRQSRPRLYQQLRKFAGTLKKAQRDEHKAREAFSNQVGLDLEIWMQGREPSPGALRTRNQLALQRTRHLGAWLSYISVRAQMTQLGLEALAQAISEQRIDESLADQILHAAILRVLALEINSSANNPV